MDDDKEINNLDNNNINKIKEYNDESQINTRNKNISSKTNKKSKLSKSTKNDKQSIIINNNNDNKEEEKRTNIILQDNSNNKKETIEDILNKTLTKKKLDPINIEKNNNEENINYNKNNMLIDNSISTPNLNINKYLKLQINEKMQKIEKLSLSQDNNKKILTELLQKLNITIKSNADLLFSGDELNKEKNDNKKDRENRMKELNLLLENKKKELKLSKDLNKNIKNKYENMMKDYTTPSTTKIDNFQKMINNMKDNNYSLNKKIKLVNYKNHLKGKKLDLDSKIKDNNEIKIYSDEYTTLMKEKYNQFVKLNTNKKLIKDAVAQFQYLIKMINQDEKNKNKEENEDEKKNGEQNFTKRLKELKIEEDFNNLKEDLSGNEENIYNRIITDNTIILGKYNSIKKKQLSIINRNKSIKKIKVKLSNLSKNLNNINNINNINNKINKKLINSKSCNDITIKNKIDNNDININSDDINYNEINFDSLTNNEYEKILAKRQKYYNLDEKLDKSIKDLSIFYGHRIKDMNYMLDENSKKLSNIQQQNELLKSKITDLKRILELNIKEQKLLKDNLRYKNNNLNRKNNNININGNKSLNNKKEKFEITDIGQDIEYKNKIMKEDYINRLKEKYNVKNKVFKDEISINQNDFDSDF